MQARGGRMSRLKGLVWGGLGALLVVASLALYWMEASDGSLERVRTAAGLRVGFAVEEPHAFYGRSGEVSGLSPEVARRVAARLGIRDIEWRLLEFGALLKELKAGRIDMVAAGMFITPERAAQVRFSDPVFHVRPGLLVARGNPHRLHSYADVLARGKIRVAVLTGSVEADAFQQAWTNEPRLIMVPDAETGRVAVETGLADALTLSAPTITWMALRHQLGKTELAHPFDPTGPMLEKCSGYGAFVFRKEDKALLEAWNREQRAFIATDEYRALMGTFGFGHDALPGGTTAAEVLAR